MGLKPRSFRAVSINARLIRLIGELDEVSPQEVVQRAISTEAYLKRSTNQFKNCEGEKGHILVQIPGSGELKELVYKK